MGSEESDEKAKEALSYGWSTSSHSGIPFHCEASCQSASLTAWHKGSTSSLGCPYPMSSDTPLTVSSDLQKQARENQPLLARAPSGSPHTELSLHCPASFDLRKTKETSLSHDQVGPWDTEQHPRAKQNREPQLHALKDRKSSSNQGQKSSARHSVWGGAHWSLLWEPCGYCFCY